MSSTAAKRHAPATLRNREAIAEVLAQELPQHGTVLEIASGSGEHAVFFAKRFADLNWQPSDPDLEALASIDAYRADYAGDNCSQAMQIDATAKHWPVESVSAMLCVNMVHISPWEATLGLFTGAARLLADDAPLILYGPYFENGVAPSSSNLDFDLSLRTRNAAWGIRNLEQIDGLAQDHGFVRTARHAMPANNLTLVYRRRMAG